MDAAAHFADVPRRYPDAAAIYFRDETYSWGELGEAAAAVAARLSEAGLSRGDAVGWSARNHPDAVAAALGILTGGFYLNPLNPNDPLGKRAADVGRLRPAAVVEMADHWTPEIEAELRGYGAVGVEITLRPQMRVALRPGLERRGQGPFRENPTGALLERMSSGTTGDPKRIPVTPELMEQAVSSALGAQAGAAKAKPPSPQMVVSPFAHASGVWVLASALYSGRPIILHEKFEAAAWVESVRRFRPKVASLVPSMINMVLELNPAPEDLSSLICIRSGTAPLDPLAKEAFETRYGMPILIDYGASEFMGGVAGWSLQDHRAFAEAKKGAVGRIRDDIDVQVVDQDTGEALGPGRPGVLCLRSSRFGSEWIRTTDLATYDEDRFLFIHGRADEAINRGGFKILPEKVAEVLRQHDGVREACVLAVKDDRLGELPLAVIERAPGSDVTADEIMAFARERMPPYEAPAHFEFVDELPRGVSLKVLRPAVRDMFRSKYRF